MKKSNKQNYKALWVAKVLIDSALKTFPDEFVIAMLKEANSQITKALVDMQE